MSMPRQCWSCRILGVARPVAVPRCIAIRVVWHSRSGDERSPGHFACSGPLDPTAVREYVSQRLGQHYRIGRTPPSGHP